MTPTTLQRLRCLNSELGSVRFQDTLRNIIRETLRNAGYCLVSNGPYAQKLVTVTDQQSEKRYAILVRYTESDAVSYTQSQAEMLAGIQQQEYEPVVAGLWASSEIAKWVVGRVTTALKPGKLFEYNLRGAKEERMAAAINHYCDAALQTVFARDASDGVGCSVFQRPVDLPPSRQKEHQDARCPLHLRPGRPGTEVLTQPVGMQPGNDFERESTSKEGSDERTPKVAATAELEPRSPSDPGRLTDEVAEDFVADPAPRKMAEYTDIDDSAAKILAGSTEIEIDLCGLTRLSEITAKHLGTLKGHVDLSGLKSLSDSAARSLGQQDSGDEWLLLNGLTALSDTAAEALSHHRGKLSLVGLKDLSDRAAQGFMRLDKTLDLSGLSDVSDVAAKALRWRDGNLILDGDAKVKVDHLRGDRSCGWKAFYHMTHRKNLKRILEYGIQSHNRIKDEHPCFEDISDSKVQSRREGKCDTVYGRLLQDYALLFLVPKGPMLYKRRSLQDDLVILEVSERIRDRGIQGVFTDGNAASKATEFGDEFDVVTPSKLVLEDHSWNWHPDGTRMRAAEFLVYPCVPIDCVTRLHCRNQEMKNELEKFTDIPVCSGSECFFSS